MCMKWSWLLLVDFSENLENVIENRLINFFIPIMLVSNFEIRLAKVSWSWLSEFGVKEDTASFNKLIYVIFL